MSYTGEKNRIYAHQLYWRDVEASRASKRAYYRKNAEHIRARAKRKSELRRRNRQAATARRNAFLAELKSGPCMDCGGRFPPYVMDFDHRDRNDKRRNIAGISRRSEILAEIPKCDLVCSNCHRIRTHRRGDSRNNRYRMVS